MPAPPTVSDPRVAPIICMDSSALDFTPRRFINLTPGEGRKEGLLMAVQPGNVAQCEFM